MRSTESQSSRSRCRVSDAARICRRDAAGRGRRHRDDVVPAVREADRLALDGLVAGQIGLGPDAAHRLHAPGQGARRAGRGRTRPRRRAAMASSVRGELGLPPDVARGVGRCRRSCGRSAAWPPSPDAAPRSSRAPWRCSRHAERHRGHLVGVERVERRRRRAPAQSPAGSARARAACRTCGARSSRPRTTPGMPAARGPTRLSRVGLPAASRYMSRVAARGAVSR